jgi:hypothetical protein
MTEWVGCDKCNSVVPAMYIVKMINGELAFCGHHFNKFKPNLDKIAYEVVELNKKEVVPQLVEMAE